MRVLNDGNNIILLSGLIGVDKSKEYSYSKGGYIYNITLNKLIEGKLVSNTYTYQTMKNRDNMFNLILEKLNKETEVPSQSKIENEYIWITRGEQYKPGDSIYSILAIDNKVFNNEYLREYLISKLNDDLKCEGADLTKTDLEYNKGWNIYILEQTWG